jgi:hypothetical protein
MGMMLTSCRPFDARGEMEHERCIWVRRRRWQPAHGPTSRASATHSATRHVSANFLVFAARGYSLSASSAFALVGSLALSGPFGPGALSSSNLLASGKSSASDSTLGRGTLSSRDFGGSAAAVPEPTTLLLALLGLDSLGCRSQSNRKWAASGNRTPRPAI